MGKLIGAITKAGKDFSDDDCMSSGAALAYYTIFSLPPLLVLVFFIAGMAGVSQDTINRLVSDQIGVPMPAEGEEGAGLQSVAGREQERSAEGAVSGLGPVSKVIGVLILIFSATGVFAQLQFALNRAWEVEPDPAQGGVMKFITKRLLSVGMIVVIGFLLLISLVLTTMVDEIVAMTQGQAPGAVATGIGIALNMVATFAIATLLFAAIFKILPDANMRWKDVWVGAAITALLFVVGKTLLGWYLQNSNIGSSWGSAAATMIGMLVWVYYSSLILLFGAEMTQVWANQYGSGIEPAKGAVRKVEEKHYVREGGRQPRPT